MCIVTSVLQYGAMCKILTGKNSTMCVVLVQVTHLWDAVPTSIKGPMSVHVLKMLALFKNTYHDWESQATGI